MASKIAIIGAGPAGLTFATLLRASRQNFVITIFEKDASPVERSGKGGTLDLHDDTGLAALRKAGLWDSFSKYARYEGQDMVFADKNANRVYEDVGKGELGRDSPGARPEIDRGRLQEILFKSVPTGWIRWGSYLRSVSTDGILTFDHGIEGRFDLIVGADGAWSKVRPVLTDIRPSYAGISGFELHILDPAQHHPEVSRMIGRGSYFAYSDCKALQAQRQGDGDVMLYAWDTNTEEYPKKLLEGVAYDGEKVKRILLETLFQDWASELQAWLQACSGDVIRPWPIYELPVGMTWEHKKGFTLIGDSAHVMSPFAGEGVNAGMKDALELAEAITESIETSRDLDSAVERFEKAMFPRMEDVMASTKMMKTFQFRDDAPLGFIEKIRELMGGV